MIEVISPTDIYADVMKKVALYLSDGVRLVWVVDVQGKAVSVHYPDQTSQRLADDASLTGEDVLAGFSLPLAELFKAG
ncbi:MAG: Uma2 family endonuclease [Anaerolineae bacterium]|nr:Uma2 family endonuclease [Anaerolineae bacterium]